MGVGDDEVKPGAQEGEGASEDAMIDPGQWREISQMVDVSIVASVL
jgi:hypothetical protein